MDELRNKAAELLASGQVQLVIGYEKGTQQPRPYFAHTPDEAKNLIFNKDCTANLAVYINKKEVLQQKTAITASYFALRSILRLITENQVQFDNLVVLTQSNSNQLIEFKSKEEIAEYLKTAEVPTREDDKVLLQKLQAMTREERWKFWSNELSKCFKCYACRAACPMCYCEKCIVEENRPQWIQPWASTLANIEWHISRAMHMAGRCANCGACGDACPLGLPIHLLSNQIVKDVEDNFGMNILETALSDNALSSFKPEDKESFIK